MNIDQIPEFDTIDRFLAVANDGGYDGTDIERRFKVERRRIGDRERIVLSEYGGGGYGTLEEWDAEALDDREAIVSEAEARLRFYLENDHDWVVKLETPPSKQ